MTYSIGKRIAAVLSAAALLACLFAGIPSLTARAGETTLKSGYYVRVRSVEIIKRKGHVMVICENPKHKQKQG